MILAEAGEPAAIVAEFGFTATAIALLRRSMPAVLVRELSSTSRSIRLTSYVVMTFSKAAAIWLTSVQLSAISVPVWSAV
ncbi:hypothetical protein [Streptomyces kaniharaensis]|uniref:hypothetical protein n=1 Tax=Streptomyces kaniharaensis TaxID=212423 RepID=UPI001E5A496C|nr:hypothetical protein [Streptomyces kaniharaensis]